MKIRVVSVIVDTKQVTLYKEDGKTVFIPQGDPRVRRIIDEALPIIQTGQIAIVDLTEANAYHDFEKAGTGKVSFWRVAKSKLAGLFGREAPKSMVETQDEINQTLQLTEKMIVEAEPTAHLSTDDAIADIMAHAEPVSAETYSDKATTSEHTIVAKVGKKIVPGVEKIESQFAHAAKLGSTIGVERFLARLAAVIEKRAHSVEDVLRFMEKGDLPIADDGSIIAYKILRKHSTEAEAYADCHTGKVKQRIGSFVCVDEALVDRNRRNECSNGLHIARRGYLGSFAGDVCVLTKIAPEDVVTVPHGDPNKVRVCGYHLLFVLSSNEFATLKRNKPIGEPEAQSLLARALRGDHTEILERVQICGQQGKDVKITPVGGAKKNTAPQKDHGTAKAMDDPSFAPEPLDPKKVDDDIKKLSPAPVKAPTAAPSNGSVRVLKARELLNIFSSSRDRAKKLEAAQQLVALKKAAKVGWPTLGVSEIDSAKLLALISSVPNAPVIAPEILEDISTVATETLASVVNNQRAPDAPPAGKYDRATHAKNLLSVASDRKHQASGRLDALQGLQILKTKSKVSWEKLGTTRLNIDRLENEISRARKTETNNDLKSVNKLVKTEAKVDKVTKAQTEQDEIVDQTIAAQTANHAAPISNPGPDPEFKPTGNIRQDNARKLYLANDFQGLKLFKARAKISWQKLGFDEDEIEIITG